MRTLLALAALCSAARAEPSRACKIAGAQVATVLVAEHEIPQTIAPRVNAAIAFPLAQRCELEVWPASVTRCLGDSEVSSDFEVCAPRHELASLLDGHGATFSVTYEVLPRERLGSVVAFERPLLLALSEHLLAQPTLALRVEVVAFDAGRAMAHADGVRRLLLASGLGPRRLRVVPRAAATARARVTFAVAP